MTTVNATAAVGTYLPNAWGIYDTHGNVYEWCRDWYIVSLGTQAVTDPPGGDFGAYRVVRGGSRNDSAANCSSSTRAYRAPDNAGYNFGFRLVRLLP